MIPYYVLGNILGSSYKTTGKTDRNTFFGRGYISFRNRNQSKISKQTLYWI